MSYKKSIFTLGEEYLNCLYELEENGGELTDDINDRLNINKDELENKINNYCDYINLLKKESEFLEDKIKELKSKIKSKENTTDRIKEYIKLAINTWGEIPKNSKNKNIKTLEHSVTFVNKPKLVVNDEILVPKEYKKFTISNLSNEQLIEIDKIVPINTIKIKEDIINDKLFEDINNKQLEIEDNIATINPDAGYVLIK